MIKILGKIIKNNKTINDYIYEVTEDFDIEHFDFYIKEMCYVLDIPSPITLIKHIKNFILFNSTYFLPNDFVEKVYFDKFQISNIRLT